MSHSFEAVVIGSGFGGAITSCRLAKQWPGKVMVLERGMRYPMGSFARSPRDFSRAFWNMPTEKRRRPSAVGDQQMHGLFDIRTYDKMDAVISAGLGGGSLIYANVFLEPPNEVFDDDRWPAATKKSALQPYYKIAKEVLGARPVPQNNDPRRRIVRTELFRKFAASQGRESKLMDIMVFFGNDFDNPLPIGHQDRNRYGAIQTSCMYCAECDVGCNYHAKNTLDLNYLHVAEHRYQASIRTEHLVDKIVPLDAGGKDDPSADGSNGYRIYYRDLSPGGSGASAVTTQRVVVSAGTLGSSELLLRCRDLDKTLPRISQHLGKSFSGNGDFLSFVLGIDEPANPNYGPVITQATDYNLFKNFDRKRAFLLEDASYPNFLAWFAEGAKPSFLNWKAVMRTFRAFLGRFLMGDTKGTLGYAFSDLLSNDISYHTAVLLCMGIDTSTGVISLDHHGNAALSWPQSDNMPLYDAIVAAGKAFEKEFDADVWAPVPNWLWPMKHNITVHCLGGCVLADDPSKGVTSADPATFGQVFGYRGLYVADGSIVPTAVGANPTATISAVSERVGEAITGAVPDANL